jgi:hypothetical protein
LDADSAPYFAALVASSCKLTAIAWAVIGSSRTFAPLISARDSPSRE